MPATSLPTVLIGLPDNLLTSALAASLSDQCDSIRQVRSWDELEGALDQNAPDVALLDVLVGSNRVLAHLSQLVVTRPSTRFIVCTSEPGEVLVERVLLAGAAGLVDHSCSVAQLAAIVIAVCRGKPWPEGHGIPSLEFSRRPAPIEPLSSRIRQVTELFWQGKSHAEVAEILGISRKTVEAHSHTARVAYGVQRGMPSPWEPIGRGGGK